MDILVFGRKKCAACETTYTLLSKTAHIPFTYFDMDTVEGLTEGALHNVFTVPTTLICTDGQVLKRWEGDVPHDIADYLKEHVT